MKTATSITFSASHTEFIELSDIERFDDGSGYLATIRVGSGEFSCSGKKFFFDDLPQFFAALKKSYRDLSGHAELRPHYEDHFVRFEFTTRGRLTVSGLVLDYGPPGQKLQFSFEADQSYLPPFIASIEAALADVQKG